MKDSYTLLKTLTNKADIKLVSRGNKAILYALRIAKKLGKKKVFIQDQGGWVTYKQFPLKLELELRILKTDYGLIDSKELKNVDENSVLLINSLTGYFAEQDMDTIYNICKDKKCLVINDISGSIGTEIGKIGDILVCSFGKDKPLNYGKGGLIAVEKKEWFKLTEIKEELGKDFYEKLRDFPGRLNYLKKINKKIKNDLKNFDIIHRDKEGINVMVKFDDKKDEIIEYCEKNNLEYKICKKGAKDLFSFIKVNEDAISIEVQRK